MIETIEARVSPEVVWEAWQKAHFKNQQKGLQVGEKAFSSSEGKSKFHYEILDVKKGESFAILWKTLFVRMIFSHSVKPIQKGSLITYSVQIKGLFAWPVRFFLGQKIKMNIRLVLKTIVRDLEDHHKT